MKIADQIRAAQETPKEQLQDYSQEYLGEEKDPAEEMPVDEAEDAEDSDEVPAPELEAITQAKRTVRDTGFLTKAEKALLRKRGWKIVAEDVDAGVGDLSKTVPSARKWIKRLMDHAKKADRELASNKEPGREMSYFVGFLKGYDDEDWYDHFYS